MQWGDGGSLMQINSDSDPGIPASAGSQPSRDDLRRALEDVQARMGGIVESAMDAIITVDEQQRIVQFNAAAERVFLWPRAAVIGRALEMLIPQRFHQAHKGHIERFATTAVTSRGMGVRSQRYSMLVVDGVVKTLNIEGPGKFEVSDALTMLEQAKA